MQENNAQGSRVAVHKGPNQGVDVGRVFEEIEAHREGKRVIVSHKHHTVVRWGVALALADMGMDPSTARGADVLENRASKGVRLEIVNIIHELVQHVLKTMSKAEATYLASLRTAPL